MKRKQINLLVDDEVLRAIEDMREVIRPIVSASEAVRRAILAERDRLKKQDERQRGGG